jgi:hypothetical protein
MSILWDLSLKIDEVVSQRGLDRILTRGKIGMEAGFLMNINKNTPDDDTKIFKLKLAVEKILGVKL